jgi:hypothetical protein
VNHTIKTQQLCAHHGVQPMYGEQDVVAKLLPPMQRLYRIQAQAQ